MNALKRFWDYLTGNLENIPILGPILLQLTNQAFWLVLVGGASFLWFDSQDLALVGWLAFLLFGVLAGMRQWRDFREAVQENRAEIEGVLVDTLHSVNVGIPYKNRIINIDIPDSLEPGISRAIVDAVLSVIPDEAA